MEYLQASTLNTCVVCVRSLVSKIYIHFLPAASSKGLYLIMLMGSTARAFIHTYIHTYIRALLKWWQNASSWQ